jgi:hypothetical protein
MDVSHIITAIIFYVLGVVSGILLQQGLFAKHIDFSQNQRMNWLIIVVSLMWAISVLYDMINPSYQTSPLIHGLMGAIVGFFFWKPNTQSK